MQPTPETAPRVLSRVRSRYDASAYGIEVNVVADSRQSVRVFDEQRLVSALENMPLLTMESG